MRVGDVERDITLARLFCQQDISKFAIVTERVRKDQATPTAVDDDVFPGLVAPSVMG